MPGSRVVLGRNLFRTGHHLDAAARVALTGALLKLEADWPDLPAAGDVADILAPTTPCWRRRLGASAWWLFYELRDDRVIAVAVAIPP